MFKIIYLFSFLLMLWNPKFLNSSPTILREEEGIDAVSQARENKNKAEESFLEALPEELIFYTLSFLDRDDLINSSLSSKLLNKWSNIILNDDYLDISNNSDFREKHTEEALLQRICSLRSKINLTFSDIRGQKLANLLPYLHSLRGLDLSSNYMEDEGIFHVGKLVNLRFLSLRANNLKGETLQQLSNLADLEILDLSANYLTNDSLSNLDLRRFPNLKALDLSCCPQITYEGFKRLHPVNSIKILWVQENQLDQEWIKHISLFENLEFLNLAHSHVISSWLEPLKSLRHIKKISLEEKTLKEADLVKFLDDTEMTESQLLYYRF